MKVSKEIAEQEFMDWFKAKKLPIYLLEKNADDKEAIISAIEEGILSKDEDHKFTQILSFPINVPDSEPITKLEYVFRVAEGVLASSMKGIKTDDLIGQISICYVSVLTGQNKGIIRALDPSDSYLGKKIAAFFFI
jgi:hypothetical protein